MKATLFFIGLLLMNLAIADDLSDSNIIFDSLERDYPESYSPSNAETYISDGYIVRYYEITDNYLGTKEGRVYAYVEELDELEDLGSIDEFLMTMQESRPDTRSHCTTHIGAGSGYQECVKPPRRR